MANPEHLAILKEGVETWNMWRARNQPVEVDLSGADLAKFDLRGAHLDRVNLIDANLMGARLDGASLEEANLTQVNLAEAYVYRANLKNAQLVQADLHGAYLIGTNFYAARMSHANMERALLWGAYLSFANLEGANLSKADICWKELPGEFVAAEDLGGPDDGAPDLSGANLTGANMTEANLSGANLTRARLDSADFTNAKVWQTLFVDVNLENVRGLDTLTHRGPSPIGIDTIYNSKGKIPYQFLRGAGVPETLIQYMSSLVGAGIEFNSLFISYSTDDQEFASRLHADLQMRGVRCWFAPQSMHSGRKLLEQIDDAIRMHDRLLLILSPSSMASEWVRTEISKARRREIKESRRVLFPITICPFAQVRDWEYFDADTGKDSAREIREYFIPDFSDWRNHNAYRFAFDRLLLDLRGKESPIA